MAMNCDGKTHTDGSTRKIFLKIVFSHYYILARQLEVGQDIVLLDFSKTILEFAFTKNSAIQIFLGTLATIKLLNAR